MRCTRLPSTIAAGRCNCIASVAWTNQTGAAVIQRAAEALVPMREASGLVSLTAAAFLPSELRHHGLCRCGCLRPDQGRGQDRYVYGSKTGGGLNHLVAYRFLHHHHFLQTTQRNLGIAVSAAGATGTAAAAATTRESCEKGIETVTRGACQHVAVAATTQESWPRARRPCTWP